MLTGQSLAAIAAGFIAALLATGLIAALARRIGFTAPFNAIVPQAREPAALGGGAGIWLGLGAGIAAAVLMGGPQAARFAAAVLPALLLGLADDARPLPPIAKLVLQILAASLAMGLMFGAAGGLILLFGGILLAVVLMNAINFLDVSDGFAAAVSAASFAGLAWFTGGVEALVMAAACLGFLAWNWPPARIYMGDAGGHLLGMAGAIIVTAAFIGGTSPSALTACFGVAIAELGLLIVVRMRRGMPVWRASPDHIALRLQRAGMTKRQAALLGAAAQGLLILAFVPFAR